MRSFRDEPIQLLFRRSIIIKLPRILDMWYKPSELAEELGVSYDTIVRSWLPEGCPHKREESGQLWLSGKEVVAWIRAIHEVNKKSEFKLGEGEAWCVHCNSVVRIEGMRERSIKKNLRIIQGKCSKCGGKVNRLKSGKEQG